MSERRYVWAWAKWPTDAWGKPGTRKGQRCRALVFGRRNSVLVEFEDGARYVTSRYGLRRDADALLTDTRAARQQATYERVLRDAEGRDG